MAQPFRQTGVTLPDEDLTPEFQARQTAKQRAKVTAQPSKKELAAMPAKAKAQLREAIAEQTAARAISTPAILDKLEESILQYESDLGDFYANIARLEEVAAEAAEEGTKAVKEGDKIIADAVVSGVIPYQSLPPVFQAVVNQQPQFSDAGLAAAIAALKAVGVEGLTDIMAQIRELYPDISSDDALLLLKFDPRFNGPYMKRFVGNKMLMDKGFAPLDDKVYLANEMAYSKIFSAYGLDKFNNREQYAKLIGNLVAPEEASERVSNVYERVTRGPQDVLKALKELYPELSTKDLMEYALDPETQLPALKRKIQAGEIGGAALAQGLSIAPEEGPTKVRAPYSNVQRNALGIETLVSEGITREQAVAGYSAVAGVQDVAEKLSAIYGRDYKQYGRLEAEKEAFLKSAEAKAARERLSAREIGEFSGSAGRLASRDRAAGII